MQRAAARRLFDGWLRRRCRRRRRNERQSADRRDQRHPYDNAGDKKDAQKEPLSERGPPDGSFTFSNARRPPASMDVLDALALFEFVERFWPIALEQSRQAAIGEKLSTGLTARAIVRFVIGIADALHGLPATRTGLPEASVYGHLFPKRRHTLREMIGRSGPKTIDPRPQRRLRRFKETNPLFIGQSLR